MPMKKFFNLPLFLFIFLMLTAITHRFAHSAFAARLRFDPSSATVSGETDIKIMVDAGTDEVESATAVVTFNTAHVKINSVTNGGAFDVLSEDRSISGEITLTGTLSSGNLEGVTGTVTMAVLKVEPLISSGTFTLGFRCNEDDIDDSNIMNMQNQNLIATNAQCAENVEGSYTVGQATTQTTSPTATPTQQTTTTTQQTTTTTSTAGQPAEPDELPQAGFASLLKWITTGLALLGIGLLLL